MRVEAGTRGTGRPARIPGTLKTLGTVRSGLPGAPSAPVTLAALVRGAGFGLYALTGLFIVTQVLVALTAGWATTRTGIGAIALLLVVAASVALVATRSHPIPTWIVAGVVAMVALSTILVTWQIDPEGEWPGAGAWHVGANTFLLLGLAVRGRIGAAWIGMAVMWGLTTVWALSTGQPFWNGLTVVDRGAGSDASSGRRRPPSHAR